MCCNKSVDGHNVKFYNMNNNEKRAFDVALDGEDGTWRDKEKAFGGEDTRYDNYNNEIKSKIEELILSLLKDKNIEISLNINIKNKTVNNED